MRPEMCGMACLRLQFSRVAARTAIPIASKPPMLRPPFHLVSRPVDSPAASVCQLATSGKKFFCTVDELRAFVRRHCEARPESDQC
jgi:hypothetical protein